MFSYQFYMVMHVIGIMFLYLGLGGALFSFATTAAPQAKMKMLSFAGHGLGLILILVGGFGMAARNGWMHQMPTWIYLKLVIWVLLGISISLVKRKAGWTAPVMGILLVLGATAATLAVYKP